VAWTKRACRRWSACLLGERHLGDETGWRLFYHFVSSPFRSHSESSLISHARSGGYEDDVDGGDELYVLTLS
jgi:hypothetical protein